MDGITIDGNVNADIKRPILMFLVWWFDSDTHAMRNITTHVPGHAMDVFLRYRLANYPNVTMEMYFAGDKVGEMKPYHYTSVE